VHAQILEACRCEIDWLRADQNGSAVERKTVGKGRCYRDTPDGTMRAETDEAYDGEQDDGGTGQNCRRLQEEGCECKDCQRQRPYEEGFARLPIRVDQMMPIVATLEKDERNEKDAYNQASSELNFLLGGGAGEPAIDDGGKQIAEQNEQEVASYDEKLKRSLQRSDA